MKKEGFVLCKKKKKIEVVDEKKKNRSYYYEQKTYHKRFSLKSLIGMSLSFIVLILCGCQMLIASGEYKGIKDIVIYLGKPISILGPSVVIAILMNNANMELNASSHSEPKKFGSIGILLFILSFNVLLFITELLLTENGVNRLNESLLVWGLLGGILISVVGSFLILAIDEFFKKSFKDSFNAGVLPISKRRILIIHLSRTREYFRNEKETRLFKIGKSDGKQFGEEVNQYINDILKEYK